MSLHVSDSKGPFDPQILLGHVEPRLGNPDIEDFDVPFRFASVDRIQEEEELQRKVRSVTPSLAKTEECDNIIVAKSLGVNQKVVHLPEVLTTLGTQQKARAQKQLDLKLRKIDSAHEVQLCVLEEQKEERLQKRED